MLQLTHLHTDLSYGPGSIVADRDKLRVQICPQDWHEFSWRTRTKMLPSQWTNIKEDDRIFWIYCVSEWPWDNYQYMVWHEGSKPWSSHPVEQMNSVLLRASYPGTKDREWQMWTHTISRPGELSDGKMFLFHYCLANPLVSNSTTYKQDQINKSTEN